MTAKLFYEQVHGTSDDSMNLNKEAIIQLMDHYLAQYLLDTAQQDILAAQQLIHEKPTAFNDVLHMASNRSPDVSTSGGFLNSEQPYSDYMK